MTNNYSIFSSECISLFLSSLQFLLLSSICLIFLLSLFLFSFFYLIYLFIYLIFSFFHFLFLFFFDFFRSYGRMSRMWETVSKRRIRFDTTFSGNYFTTQSFESEKCGKELYHSIFKIYTCLLLARRLSIE